MDWRLHYLLVRTAVAREVLERLRAFAVDQRGAGSALTPEEADRLSSNVARVVKELSVGDKRGGVVNVFFSFCDIEAENRMVLDADEEVCTLVATVTVTEFLFEAKTSHFAC